MSDSTHEAVIPEPAPEAAPADVGGQAAGEERVPSAQAAPLTAEAVEAIVQQRLEAARNEWAEEQRLLHAPPDKPAQQAYQSPVDVMVSSFLGEGATADQVAEARHNIGQIDAWESKAARATTGAERAAAEANVRAYRNRLEGNKRDVMIQRHLAETNRKPAHVDTLGRYNEALKTAQAPGFHDELKAEFPALAAQIAAGTVTYDEVLREVDWSAADAMPSLQATFQRYERHAKRYAPTAAPAPSSNQAQVAAVPPPEAPQNPGGVAPGESPGYSGRSTQVATVDEYHKKIEQRAAARRAARQSN